jgi:hypothetical protein
LIDEKPVLESFAQGWFTHDGRPFCETQRGGRLNFTFCAANKFVVGREAQFLAQEYDLI